MLKTIKLIVMATLCLNFSSKAQSQTNDIKPLKIGDTIPEAVWKMPLQVVNHPEGKTVITLNDYKGKLIILDFWNTYCAPCISSISKLNLLNKQIIHQVEILPVTEQEKRVVLPFVKKNGWELTMLTGNTLLQKYFSHATVPHLVWIQHGRILAITGSEYATLLNFNSLIANKSLKMFPKSEYNIDFEKPLVTNQDSTSPKALYRSVITSPIQTRGAGISWSDTTLLVYNSWPVTLFSEAFLNGLVPSEIGERMELQIPDSLKKMFLGVDLELQGVYEKDKILIEFSQKNRYCYNLTLSENLKISRKEMRVIMQQDLNRFFALQLGIEAFLKLKKKNGQDVQILVIKATQSNKTL